MDHRLATVGEEAQGGRARKVYSITKAGRDEFAAWLQDPVFLITLRSGQLGREAFVTWCEESIARLKARAAGAS